LSRSFIIAWAALYAILAASAGVRKSMRRKAVATDPSDLAMHMALESRDASTASKLMAMGTKAGVPDFLMPIVPFEKVLI
jgi:hypothetical protein